MNRTDRLYAVREELRRAGPRGRTTEQLAETFEVSVRTVKRDVAALQSGGFPVWARLGRGGGYVVDAAATLPPVNLTPAEVSGLAVALTGAQGQPFAAQARTALAKVLAVAVPADRERAERLAARVWLDRADEQPAVGPDRGHPVVDPGVRSAVEEALATRHVLALHYRDGDGAFSRRRVAPQILAGTGGYWYLVAHCHHRDAIRWFRLDRIVAARLTQQTSVDRPVADLGTPPPTARPASLDRPDT